MPSDSSIDHNVNSHPVNLHPKCIKHFCNIMIEADPSHHKYFLSYVNDILL